MTPTKKAAAKEPTEVVDPETVEPDTPKPKISKAQQAGLPRWPEQPGVPPPE